MARGVDFYERTDGKWEWRLTDNNNQIIATSGSQGYEELGGAKVGWVNVCEEITKLAATAGLDYSETHRQPSEGDGDQT